MPMQRVLVIDDEITILENIKFVLELENYEVLTASSSKAGLDIFHTNMNSIDVVITDMRMPVITGMDILKEVKRCKPEVGVIILTGHGDLENAILAMKEGAFEYLRKPVNAHDLAIAINNAINKKHLLLENTRIQQELLEHKNYLQGLHDSSQKILMNMLPKKLPEIPGINFSVEYKSSDAVGGDMYDICDIGDYVCFYVFDVASHGILASVIAIILKSFIQNIEYNYQQGINKRRFPEIVADLNKVLYANTAQNVFASLFLGFIDKKTKVFYFVSAGHITQYMLSESNITPLESTGIILGVFEEANYTCTVVKLKPGDKILLFTDGITEATSENEVFGDANLIERFQQCDNKNIDATIQYVYNTVKEYTGGLFDDDVTLLGLEITEE